MDLNQIIAIIFNNVLKNVDETEAFSIYHQFNYKPLVTQVTYNLYEICYNSFITRKSYYIYEERF